MVRVQAGDEPALEALMARWRGPLHGFLWRRVGEGADDLFQETWIRVVRARDRFDPRRRFSTWLFQIAHNLCRDRWRRQKVEQRGLDAVHDAARLQPDAAPAPDPGDGGALAGRVRALPARLRDVLLLRYYQDFSEAEIADVLRIPRGTVKSRLHAALRALRSQQETDR